MKGYAWLVASGVSLVVELILLLAQAAVAIYGAVCLMRWAVAGADADAMGLYWRGSLAFGVSLLLEGVYLLAKRFGRFALRRGEELC